MEVKRPLASAGRCARDDGSRQRCRLLVEVERVQLQQQALRHAGGADAGRADPANDVQDARRRPTPRPPARLRGRRTSGPAVRGRRGSRRGTRRSPCRRRRISMRTARRRASVSDSAAARSAGSPAWRLAPPLRTARRASADRAAGPPFAPADRAFARIHAFQRRVAAELLVDHRLHRGVREHQHLGERDERRRDLEAEPRDHRQLLGEGQLSPPVLVAVRLHLVGATARIGPAIGDQGLSPLSRAGPILAV